MNWPAIVAGIVTVLILGVLLPLAICADSKRRDRIQTVARVVPVGSTAPVAEALAQAVEHHINSGGRVEDVIGFQEWAHPCGGVHINLVLASDAVTEAQQILRAGESA